MKQEKIILDAAFPVALYEMEKAIKEGWNVSQEREPIYIAGLYEIVMEKVCDDVEEEVLIAGEILASGMAESPAKRGPKPKGK